MNIRTHSALWMYVGVVGGMVLAALVTLLTQMIIIVFVSTIGPRISLFFASPITRAAQASAPFVFVASWAGAIILTVRHIRHWNAMSAPAPEAVSLERSMLTWFVVLSTLGGAAVLMVAAFAYRGFRALQGLDAGGL